MNIEIINIEFTALSGHGHFVTFLTFDSYHFLNRTNFTMVIFINNTELKLCAGVGGLVGGVTC